MKIRFAKRKGVSLYEMIMVMAIIGIVTAIAIPVMNNFVPSLKLSSSAKVVLTEVRQAQEEAVTTQISHLVRFDSSTDPPKVLLIKKEASETTIEETELGKGITFTPDAAFQNPTTHQYEVAFSSDGGPSASGNIAVILDTAQKTINISPAGVIKLLQ